MAEYGLRTFDENGNIIVDISSRLTKILWEGIIKFPNDVPTGPNWPNTSTNNFTHASRSITIQSDGFLTGTPFVMFHDHNCTGARDHQMAGIMGGISWSMQNSTTMGISYRIFSPGWSQNEIKSRYPNLDIPVMVGVF